jgi:predicted RNA binding protein YcfA (HicA-like mRNA interferase family)
VYIYSDRVTSNGVLRLLRRTGAVVVADPGKGGQVMVTLAGRRTFVPTGTGELRPGTLHAILRDLAVTLDSPETEVTRYL